MNIQIDTQALARIAAQLSEMASVNTEDRKTLETYIHDVYIPYLRDIPSKKPSNLKKDLYLINTLLTFPVVKLPMNKITVNDLTMFFSSLQKERGVAKATINRYRTRLGAIYNHAINLGLVSDNPVKKIGKNYEPPRTRYLKLAEIESLLEECRNSRNVELYMIVVLALNTGMRAGEILNLKRGDIVNDMIFLSGHTTKTGLDLKIPINDCLRECLELYINRTGKRDKLFKTRSFRSAFDYAKKRAGILDLRFHDLRRTFATHLKDLNVDLHSISRLLGHTTVVTTGRYLGTSYRKLLDSVQVLSFKQTAYHAGMSG